MKLAKSGFYDGLHFHRVIDGFMVAVRLPPQPDPKSPRAGTGDGPDGTVQDEHPANAKLSNEPGTLAMANTGAPNSGSCQFFINTVHNSLPRLLHARAPPSTPSSGASIDGLDVLSKIEKTRTDGSDRPVTPVRMNKITVTE